MMNSALFGLFESASKKEVEFVCPSCGHINKISNETCESCKYDLSETKSVMFSHYSFYNKALKYEEEGKYFEAIIEISKFLAYEPADETANKLFIYYLNKCGKKEEVQTRLDEFEKNFPRNPWIMQVEMKGIDNIPSPADSLKEINFTVISNQLTTLSNELAKSKVQTTSELGTIAMNFYSNLLRPAKANKELYSHLSWFYENVIVPQLAKREIRLESFEGKNYNDLTTEEVACVDVKSTIEYKGLPDGIIITDVPAVYVRSSLLKKQQIYVVKNPSKEEKKAEAEAAKLKKKNEAKQVKFNRKKKKHGGKK